MLPGIIELNSISYTQSKNEEDDEIIQSLTITGISPDETTIVNYVRDLRNSGQFSEVLIADMLEVDFNEWSFNLTLK